MLYHDRIDAGRQLAERLMHYAGRPDVVVLALPRGGVPVGYEVARALGAPLDVFLVRKLGVPGQPELAMGAIASGGARVFNSRVVHEIHPEDVAAVTEQEERELLRREEIFRAGLPPLDVAGKTVILVDDGLATGSTMRAAVKALEQLGPERVVVAVPVASPDVCAEFRAEVDEVVCAAEPDPFRAVGLWYHDFAQTSDEEVCGLLAQAASEYARNQRAARSGRSPHRN